MVSQRLKNIFLLTLIPIYIHGIEEVVTGFPHVDDFMKFGANYFRISPAQFYWDSHIIFWISLPLLYLLFQKKRIALLLFSLFGIFFIVELHHIYKAIYFKSYYPGLLTALIYPLIGVFYYQELLRNWRKKYGRN